MYESMEEILHDMQRRGLPLWKVVQLDDCRERGISESEAFSMVRDLYIAMRESNENYDAGLKSHSGLVGGLAEEYRQYAKMGDSLVGPFLSQVMEKALRIAESNACMKRIVAAPTAGSCGVVPAVLLSIQERNHYSDDQMTEALYVAAGIGGVIAAKASLAGAAGGCQAEIGAASAMAAGGLTYLLGGDGEAIANAAALALKNLLGLACDPVAGLVEVPCVKRNVCGAVNAVTSAELTMAGIRSQIPADEVFEAMNNISKGMSENIRETSNGGLATTPTGQRIKEMLSR